MNLLFRIVYAAHANGTHHKLALDALRHLEDPEGERWRRLFLKHAKLYLEGSKAPDKEFKDFKNHVLHVRDDYWGGAPEKVESWYGKLVESLKAGSWHEAVWAAGIMSHYYTDPIHPFHTAQSKAESEIHRAVEWSISKSYAALLARGAGRPLPEVLPGHGPSWIKDHVIAGAERSNVHYETLIARYDFRRGVVDPPAGLDGVSQDVIGDLLVYAAIGHARLLDRAFEEAGVEPPEVTLTTETVIAALGVPLAWVTRKLDDAQDRRQVEAIYDELTATGTVEVNLPEDDRQVRDLYAREVVGAGADRRQAVRDGRVQETRLAQGQIPRLACAPKAVSRGAVESQPRAAASADQPRAAANADPKASTLAGPQAAPSLAAALAAAAASSNALADATPEMLTDAAADAAPAPETVASVPGIGGAPSAAATGSATTSAGTIGAASEALARLRRRSHDDDAGHETVGSVPAVGARGAAPADPPQDRASKDEARPDRLRTYLAPADDIEAAPSIGAKTAARFQAIGITTVAELLEADPAATAQAIDTRHIQAKTIIEWQHQARLVCDLPGLRGGHAQLLVGAGLTSVEAIAAAEPGVAMAAILQFAQTSAGQSVLRDGDPPDLEKVMGWVERARTVRAAA